MVLAATLRTALPLILSKSRGLYFTKKEKYTNMDFETFFESLFRFIQSSDNAYFVLYAAMTCALTQVFKKLFVSKVKVDILHKFDWAVAFPFIFGAIFAVLDVFAVKRVGYVSLKVASDVLVNAAAIGALASTIFKLFSSLSGKKLSSLMTDDVFGMFYTQLLYYGNIREQLTNKELTLSSFVDEVKLVASNALTIYKADCDEETKRQNLAKLLTGIIDEQSVNTCVNTLNKALLNYVASKAKADVKTK